MQMEPSDRHLIPETRDMIATDITTRAHLLRSVLSREKENFFPRDILILKSVIVKQKE